MGNPRRAAIIGGGMVGRVHRRSLAVLGVRVAGVLGSNPQRGEAFAAEWEADRAFSSAEEIAESDVDVVHICSPTGTHAEYARIMLEAGKHVVCEKPLTTTAEDAEELAALANRAGVVAAVPYVYRYYSAVREVRDRVRDGRLGALTLVHGSYLQDWLLDPHATSWRVLASGGGRSRAFADIGSHWCDLVEWVTGEQFTAVVAQRGTTVPRRPRPAGLSFSGPAVNGASLIEVDTEDIATLMLRTGAGVLANLTVSQVSSGRKNRLWFEIDGSAGSAWFDQEDPEHASFGGDDGSVQVFARGTGAPHRTDLLPAGHPQGWGDAFTAFLADVYAAVAGEPAGDMPTFADGVRTAHLIEAVLASADTDAWTEIAR